MEDKTKEFYDKLEHQLENFTSWPAPYLFKFIVPSDEDKISQIKSFFTDVPGAEAKSRTSSKGQYTSVSIKAIMPSAESIVEKYKQVSVVEGLMSL